MITAADLPKPLTDDRIADLQAALDGAADRHADVINRAIARQLAEGFELSDVLILLEGEKVNAIDLPDALNRFGACYPPPQFLDDAGEGNVWVIYPWPDGAGFSTKVWAYSTGGSR